MEELIDHYMRASEWTLSKVRGAVGAMEVPTPCEGWDVRELIDHMLETQRYFIASARQEPASPPSQTPRRIVGDDPVGDFERARSEFVELYSSPEVRERTGPLLGIALADQLLHGWDAARATDQDATMPDGLAQVALDQIHGRFTEQQRVGVFKPELPAPPGASAQDRLLAYTGRAP